MSILQIADTEETGELRWGIALVNDEGTAIMRNRTPLAQGVANSTAKALIHKGPDSPTLEKVPEDADARAVWIIEKTDQAWTARLALIPDTDFVLLLKEDETLEDPKSAILALEDVKTNLRKAEIKWIPPEADPAYEHKAAVITPTLGHPGS